MTERRTKLARGGDDNDDKRGNPPFAGFSDLARSYYLQGMSVPQVAAKISAMGKRVSNSQVLDALKRAGIYVPPERMEPPARMNPPTQDDQLRRLHRQAGTGDLDAARRYVAALERIQDGRAPETERERYDRQLDEAERLVRSDYYRTVRSYAEAIKADLVAGSLDGDEALDRRVWETADGTNLVIVTNLAQRTLWISDHSDASLEDGIMDDAGVGRDQSVHWSGLAMGAFMRDLWEALETIGVDRNGLVEGREDAESTDEDEGSTCPSCGRETGGLPCARCES